MRCKNSKPAGWMVYGICRCYGVNRKVPFYHFNLKVTTAIGRCGECDRPLIVLGDDGHIYEVGQRLLSNAIQKGGD